MSRDYWKGVGTGIALGLLWGGLLGALAGIGYLTGGSAARQYDSLWHVAGTYLGGGAAGGLIGGLLHPLLRKRHNVLVIGPLALVPTVMLVRSSMLGPIDGWGKGDWYAVIAISIMLGAPVGYLLYPKIVRGIA